MNKYNQLFKQQVVNFYFEHHENLAFTLKHFNLAAKSVRCWIAQYKYSGTHGLAVLHHKKQNQGLPPNLLCRRRKRASGQIVEYFYYILANGKEKSLGSDKYHAVLEAAKLNMASHQVSEIVLFIDVAKRYELEVVPTKSKSTQLSNRTAIKWLCRFFGNPPVALEKIEPKHISQYLQWRKNNPPSANNEVGLLSHIWNKAREWGYTKLTSPSQGVEKYPVKFRDVYIEDYLLEKLIECADGQMRDILQMMYLIGQRPIDICKIHRSHIYNSVLHITQNLLKK